MYFIKKYWAPFFMISLLSFVFVFLAVKENKNGKITHLKRIMFFPSESDSVLLMYPTKMQIDEEGFIYVIDQSLSSIIKFTADGQFVNEIGRCGQGPGEFERPNRFVYDNEKLFVVDQGNRRIQILNSTGEYLSSFKLFRLIHNIAHFNTTIIGQQSYRSDESNIFHFLTFYNHYGSIKSNFGEPINDLISIPELPPYASDVMLRLYNNRIYTLYWYYPMLHVYKFDGTLLKYYKLEDQRYRNLIPGNYDLARILKKPNFVNLKYLFLAFDVNNFGMFLCLYKDDIEIHHYNFEGNLKNFYIYKNKGDEYYVRDLKVMYQDGRYKFYILLLNPLPRIEVFTLN